MPVQPALRLDDWPRLLGQGLEQGDVMLLGARGSALAKCLADSQSQLARPLLIVAPDPEAAGDIHADLVFYLAEHGGGEPPFLWPTWDILPDETESPDLETASDQLAILRSLVKPATFPWVVCPITALLQPTLPPDILARGGFRLGPGKEISPEAVVAHLAEAGLEASPMVEEPGQFSRRGGIVDVFPLLGGQPYRIEFFGDEVDTVRPFSPATQESGAVLDSEVVLVDVPREAFRLTGTGGRRHSLLDYLSPATLVVVRHPERSARVAGLYASGFSGLSNTLFPLEQAAARLSPFRKMLLPDLDSDPWPEDPWPRPVDLCPVDLMATGWERLSGNFDTSLRELSQLHQGGTRLCITCNNPAEEKRLREVLTEKAPDLLADIRLAQGHLSRGFIREGDSAYVSDHELFGRQTPIRAPRKRYQGIPITDFAELREGDYVVHVANGIARFEGIKTLERDGAEQDFLNLLFAEDARIYVPLSQIELVQRYIGLGGARPQLSKLGSSAWSRKKATVENAVRDIAQDLLATQARRLSSPGLAIPPDDAMVEEFDASFPYDETPDQLSAMLDICHDQQSVSPMERLLCGDVGFGKTEMAVRAAFRVVNAGRQVAVLVPTTILAEQHYRTFTSRMADYPVRVECLSRFRSPSEQKAIVENVLQGRTDVVIGTHRLLSEDVAFKNLGLVVIDEEQKFGVENKERLKRFRAEVDILTMTATPIPRTLHMSLLGLRDISNLATPPRERHSVKTMVVRYADDIVRRAILRELSRGGQSFFLHNRVHNIDQIAGHLQSLVPEARVAVGHGQMAEGELLDVITRFLDGKVDVLVCTTIIESGVDMPRVNTLMVNYADHFGLSELHQLRGRVGRFRHQAYAYFLVPANRPLSPEAGKRLQALQDYSELGSGFRIAMRDLEIRGAGNLLGVEQSGHIHLIGFDLYCRLLERAVAAGKGEAPEEEAKVELDLGTSAFIPPDYIPSEQQRIEFYRRLLRTRSAEDLAVSHAYVRDRYGVLPAPVERCFADQGLRISMLDNGLISLGRIEGALAVGFSEASEKKGVAALRHAGWRATLLRRQFWRLEPAGKDNSFPADPVRQAEVLLAVLAAAPARSESQRRRARPGKTLGHSPVPVNPAEALRQKGNAPPMAELDPGIGPVLPGEPKTLVPEAEPPPSRRRKKVVPRLRPEKTLETGESTGKVAASKKGRRVKGEAKTTPVAAVVPETPFRDGLSVIGIEPRVALSRLVVVAAGDNPLPGTDQVTLLVLSDPPRRFRLHFLGVDFDEAGRYLLSLQAATPLEVGEMTATYLAAGKAGLYPGWGE